MAQYMAIIQGSRGEASRLGGVASGIRAQAQSWSCGVQIIGSFNATDGRDEFHIDGFGGSRHDIHSVYIGKVYRENGEIVFIPAEHIRTQIRKEK